MRISDWSSDVCSSELLTVWLNKLEAEKQEREQAAREANEKAQQEAIEARRAAIGTGDLNAIDAADDLLGAAEEAGQALKAVEKEKVQAKGEHRAIGLRSRWIARLRDGEGGKALTYYAKTQPERVKSFQIGRAACRERVCQYV